jgi:hypothetical protein
LPQRLCSGCTGQQLEADASGDVGAAAAAAVVLCTVLVLAVVLVEVVKAVWVLWRGVFVCPIVSRCQWEPGTFGVETSGWWPALQPLRR